MGSVFRSPLYISTYFNMSNNDWKSRLNVVYSTNPDFEYTTEADTDVDEIDNNKQTLRVWLDKKSRAGKKVTLVKGFIGSEDALKELASTLKSSCGVGGSAKDGEIIIQGDFRDKIVDILIKKGYTATKKAGN